MLPSSLELLLPLPVVCFAHTSADSVPVELQTKVFGDAVRIGNAGEPPAVGLGMGM